MAVIAKLNNLKITARKVRLVADLIRRKPVVEAEAILRFTPKKASLPLLKLLQSATANAKTQSNLEPQDLIIKTLLVNEGPMQERVFPRSRGRADKIQKKTSHITLILENTKSLPQANIPNKKIPKKNVKIKM